MLHTKSLRYRRILLKLSGELFSQDKYSVLCAKNIENIVNQIKSIKNLGIQIGIVIGGGNLFRGKELYNLGMKRIISDQIGMLSTVINSLALHEKMQNMKINSCVFSSKKLESICRNYRFDKVIECFKKNYVVIFCLGLGHPFFTTDSAACLRAIEINADILLKATHIDGVYSDDPKQNPSATFYKRITYNDVIHKNITIMDQTSIILARDNNLPIYVFNMDNSVSLLDIISGLKTKGTLISN